MLHWVVWILFICLIFGLICWCFGEPENTGIFGDQFGALTSWFTGIAFAVMIITLRLQKKELQLTREAVLASKNEISASKAASEKKQMMDILSFLLNQYRHLKNELTFIEAGQTPVTFKGSEVLRHIAEVWGNPSKIRATWGKEIVEKSREAHVEGCVSILLIIIKTIESTKLIDNEKEAQKEIIKNMLTKNEKLVYKYFFPDYHSPLFNECQNDNNLREEIENIFMVN